MTVKLRYYQENALQALHSYLMTNPTGNALIGMPTGTGKSLLPAEFIRRTMYDYPNSRFLMVTHVSELIKQNMEELLKVWPNAPIGIHSAGLKQRDYANSIIFGGIQSMFKDPAAFGRRDLAFVDEAHLISTDESSMYQKFFALMKLINPHMRIVGMSATLYRMGQGYITDGDLFQDIVYDDTSMDRFNQLIAEGYLCPLIPQKTDTFLDVSGVGISNGDFVAKQLQGAVDKNEITFAGLKEVVVAGHNRRSWLIFASGVEHAEHIAEMLMFLGIDCAPVHSKRTDDWNDMAIKAFKEGRLRSIVNYGKLTTGFNHPWIDLIAMFRPSMSVPLWVQMLGRGTRPVYAPGFDLEVLESRIASILASGKTNCLVLDFARNTPRLGPINDPIIPRKKGEKQGDAPIKLCNSCGAYNHISARFCCQCEAEFQFQIKITSTAGTAELIRSDFPVYETFEVQHAIYAMRQKIDKPTRMVVGKPYIRATYFTGIQSFSENIFPEHDASFTKRLYHDWWKQRHTIEPPATTAEALQHQSELRTPRRIRVWANKKPFPEIVSCEY